MYTSFQNATKQTGKYDGRAKLGCQPDIKLNTVLQFRYQRRIYTPSFVFYQQSLHLLKTNLWPPSENHISDKKVFIVLKCISKTFLPA